MLWDRSVGEEGDREGPRTPRHHRGGEGKQGLTPFDGTEVPKATLRILPGEDSR